MFFLLACQSPPLTDTASADDSATELDTADTTDTVAYPEVATILDTKCADCHYSEPEGLRLYGDGVYDLLVGRPSGQLPSMDRVSPGSLADSYLWHKLQDTHEAIGGEGSVMPTLYGEALTEAEIEVFRAWIVGGARP